jgi:antitoxin component of MazEF toxin-antitoxin module
MKVSPAGAVPIPPPLQDEAGIHPGSEVEVRHENGAIVIRRREPDEETRAFLAEIEALRAAHRQAIKPSAKSLEEVAGLSRGEQFVRLLANAGIDHMTTDEFMEMMRGPYDDLDPH